MKSRRKFSVPLEKLRSQAEELLARTPREIAKMPIEDVQKLVHELQVHQVELEMQNEQLRRSELELEEALDRYADLYNFAPVAHLTLSAEGEILEANLNAGELLGLEHGRLIRQKFSRFVPAEAQDTFYLFCRQVFDSGSRQSAEFELMNAQAKQLFVHAEAARDPASARKQGRFSFINITGRREAEEALRASERFAQSVVNSMAANIAIVDQHGQIIAVNKRWRDFAANNGTSPEAVSEGANYLAVCELAVQADLVIAKVPAGLCEVLAGRAQEFCSEYPCHSPNEWRWFTMRVTSFPGKDPGYVVVAHEDITERKRTEVALQEASQLNRQIIAGAKEGIIVYDRDLKYVVWNPFMEELTGIPAAEIIGKPAVEIFPFLQGVGVIEQLNHVLAGAECGTKEFPFHVPQSGRSGWASDTNSPLRNAKGEITGVIGIVRDITERKRAEERIARLDRAKAILGGVDHAIVHVPNRQKLLDEICRVAVKKGGFKLAWIGMVSPDGSVQPVAKAGTTEYLKDLRVVTRDEPAGRGPVGEAIRKNRPVVIEDIGRDARMAPWRDRARKFGLCYLAAFRIRIADKVTGSLQVYAPRVDFFDEAELELLTQVSDDISFALTGIADLAARTQAEAALRRSERSLANFFNQAPIGLIWLSASGTVLRANQAELDHLGYVANDYLGNSFTNFCVEPARGRELLERLSAKETVRNFPMTRRCKDSTIQHVLVDANSFWSGGELQHASLFLRDITDRVRLEREILHAGEREHRHMAQDLHDGLGQLLVGTAYMASTLRQQLAAKSLPEAREIGRIQKVISEAIAQTRSLARGLHPVEAEANGLMAALETLAARTKKLFRIKCHFTCRRPVLIEDNAVATHLFRIAQEAVTNAIKHGQPGRIEISLTRTQERINLAVKDNGSGMSAKQRTKPGMGLRIMRYRAGMIGGSLAIQKEAGGGTAIVCSVHLSGQAAGNENETTPRNT